MDSVTWKINHILKSVCFWKNGTILKRVYRVLERVLLAFPNKNSVGKTHTVVSSFQATAAAAISIPI